MEGILLLTTSVVLAYYFTRRSIVKMLEASPNE